MAKSKRVGVAGRSSLRSVRVIGGQWRSRKIEFVDGEGLRPTPDRVRETLFNWLAADIPAAHCLDLFAGTGVLGFEALSRGAAEVVAVEKSARACAMVERNCESLSASDYHLQHADAIEWLEHATNPVDILFLDPPFEADLWQVLFMALAGSVAVNPDTLIYLECPAGPSGPELPANWQMLRKKTAAAVCYGLYRAG